MIPTLRLVWLAGLGLPLALLGLFGRGGLALAAAYDAVLGFLGAADRLAAPDPAALRIRRSLPRRWIQGRPDRVHVQLLWKGSRVSKGARVWKGPRAGRFVVRDLPPASFEARLPRGELVLVAGREAEFSYEAIPRERGDQVFGAIAVRSRGPFGLIERQIVVERDERVRVSPDLVSLSARDAALVAPGRWRSGVRRGPVAGEGREFHQLRDYAAGDDARLVDWKAFARHGRPAVREYRAERNQRILLMIDSGRLMTARVGDRTRFDWAIQAAGRLARVALAFGDSVGLAFFSRSVRAQVPASRGAGHLGRLAEMLSVARADLDEPDLGSALTAQLRRGPRRSLVVIFTEISDPRAGEALLRHVGALAPRHLGLVVTLADADLEAARQAPIDTVGSAYRRVAADELWQETRRTEQGLHARGVLVVRARADALAGEAVERYLEIKRRGRL